MRAWWVILVIPLATASSELGRDGLGIDNATEPVPFTWYAHLDGIQDFPIARTAPPESFSDSIALGAATHTLTCLAEGMGPFHTWYGIPIAGRIDYDTRARYHREAGLAGDVDFQTIDVHWYIETQAVAADGPVPQPPMVLPRLVVAATMRASDAISLDERAYNEAPLVAAGAVGPFDLSPLVSDPQVEHIAHGDRHIYHVTVPLAIENGRVSHEDGFNLRMDTYLDVPGCDADHAVMPNHVRVVTAPELRPRLEGTLLAATIQSVGIQVGEVVAIDVQTQSPLGLEAPPVVRVTGPDGTYDVPWTAASGPGMRFGVHCHCYDQALVDHYFFTPKAPGHHVVEVDAADGEAVATAAFDTDGRVWNVTTNGVEAPQDVQATPLPWILPLAALSLVLRRR